MFRVKFQSIKINVLILLLLFVLTSITIKNEAIFAINFLALILQLLHVIIQVLRRIMYLILPHKVNVKIEENQYNMLEKGKVEDLRIRNNLFRIINKLLKFQNRDTEKIEVLLSETLKIYNRIDNEIVYSIEDLNHYLDNLDYLKPTFQFALTKEINKLKWKLKLKRDHISIILGSLELEYCDMVESFIIKYYKPKLLNKISESQYSNQLSRLIQYFEKKYDVTVYTEGLNNFIKMKITYLTALQQSKLFSIERDENIVLREYVEYYHDFALRHMNLYPFSILMNRNYNQLKKQVTHLLKDIRDSEVLIEYENEMTNSSYKHNIFSIEYLDELDGLEFEKYLENLFEEMNYIIERTKSSGDQGADLILNAHGKKILIQAKRYNGSVGNKAVQEVISAKEYYNSLYGMVVSNSNYTKSAIQLAMKANIVLIDRVQLTDIIENGKSKFESILLHNGFL